MAGPWALASAGFIRDHIEWTPKETGYVSRGPQASASALQLEDQWCAYRHALGPWINVAEGRAV